jgi:tripartite-type tricarboxylate transporter receptor subunit TctC
MYAVIASVSAMLIAGNVCAQNYPEKPIRLLVGFPPGSQVDTIARLLGQRLTDALGKPIVVDNAPGAAGRIAAGRVAKAAPDGYTLGLLNDAQIVTNTSMHEATYDPDHFAPISQLTGYTYVLVVHNAVPVTSVKELVALAKAQPGELTFASGGSGSSPHTAAELLKSMAGVDIRHVPYKGVVAAVPDLLAGRVTMMFSPIATVLPTVREGKLRALAVSSLRRSAAAPEVPTIAESGYPGFEYMAWHGLVAPAGTPSAIIRKLHLETVKALGLPELRAKLTDLGLEAIGNSPEDFAMTIRSQMPKRAKLIGDARIKAD